MPGRKIRFGLEPPDGQDIAVSDIAAAAFVTVPAVQLACATGRLRSWLSTCCLGPLPSLT